MQDEDLMNNIRNFNQKYGEDLVIQFKDFDTGDIVFNVYLRINDKEIIYFEPMPPAENPKENVKVELDINKLLDIIEYEESGRIELESPPWDRQPRTTFVKGAIDGVRMYMMFMSLMNSLESAPSSAESDAKFFVRYFFEAVMGDGDKHEISEEEREKIAEELKKQEGFSEPKE